MHHVWGMKEGSRFDSWACIEWWLREVVWRYHSMLWDKRPCEPGRCTMRCVGPEMSTQGLSTGDWAQALHGVQSTALHSPRRQCIAMHSPHTSQCTTRASRVHARKIYFSNFVKAINWLKYFPRSPPSRPNSLSKNLKKWEKNPRKSCFLSFFVKNG